MNARNPGAEAFMTLSEACALDPLFFSREILRRQYWSKQRDLAHLIRSHDRVWAKGGHSTGKTLCFADGIVEHMAMNPGAKCVIVGPKFDQVKVNLWAAIREAYHRSRFDIGGVMGADSWKLGDEWWARCAGADRPESLHLGHGVAMLVVLDEAAGIDKWAVDAVLSMLASSGSRLWVAFNPRDASGPTREMVDDPRFAGVTMSCLEHPNVVQGEDVIPGAVTAEWVAEIRARVDRGIVDEDEWRWRVLGEFPSGASNALVTASDLERGAATTATDVPRLGLDVARFGHDRNVLTLVDAKRRAVVADEWAGQDLMHTTGRLIAAVKKYGVSPSMTFVDACGVGGGVVDRARELGCAVRAVDAGAGATGRWSRVVGRETSFANVRAEMFWALRCLIKSGELNVDKAYWSDLGMIRHGYSSSGDVLIKSKEQMRSEYGRSPDRADSLALAFAAPHGGVWAVAG